MNDPDGARQSSFAVLSDLESYGWPVPDVCAVADTGDPLSTRIRRRLRSVGRVARAKPSAGKPARKRDATNRRLVEILQEREDACLLQENQCHESRLAEV